MSEGVRNCRGNQKKIYHFLNCLLGRRSASKLPGSESSLELANNFSNYFATKIMNIREEIALTRVSPTFSVDFVVVFPVDQVFSHFESVLENTVVQYIRELSKTYCPLDPIDFSKLGSFSLKAAPYIVAIINCCFRESNFVVPDKKALIRPT